MGDIGLRIEYYSKGGKRIADIEKDIDEALGEGFERIDSGYFCSDRTKQNRKRYVEFSCSSVYALNADQTNSLGKVKGVESMVTRTKLTVWGRLIT